MPRSCRVVRFYTVATVTFRLNNARSNRAVSVEHLGVRFRHRYGFVTFAPSRNAVTGHGMSRESFLRKTARRFVAKQKRVAKKDRRPVFLQSSAPGVRSFPVFGASAPTGKTVGKTNRTENPIRSGTGSARLVSKPSRFQ